MFEMKASIVISACLTLQNNNNTFLGYYMRYVRLLLSDHLSSRLRVR
jgi:hypothetical protein